MKHHFYIVDVFTEQAYSGNPLAVVIVDRMLSDSTMQKIAAEINFSETTFVSPTPEMNSGYRVRIFTPSQEIAFAGHPILGTAYVIRKFLQKKQSEQVVLNFAVNNIQVTFEQTVGKKEIAWFNAPPMTMGAIAKPEPVAAALNISLDEIETKGPIQVVSAGTSAMIVPVKNLKVLKKSILSLNNFKSLAKQNFPSLTYLFCEETHDPKNDLCVRFFFEAHGVREDPATGNGAAFLGAYLLQHNYFSKSNLHLRIEQGHEIRRPSLIMLQAANEHDSFAVKVGGNIVPVAQGELV